MGQYMRRTTPFSSNSLFFSFPPRMKTTCSKRTLEVKITSTLTTNRGKNTTNPVLEQLVVPESSSFKSLVL